MSPRSISRAMCGRFWRALAASATGRRSSKGACGSIAARSALAGGRLRAAGRHAGPRRGERADPPRRGDRRRASGCRRNAEPLGRGADQDPAGVDRAGGQLAGGRGDVRAAGRSEMVVTDEDRQHWSYRPLRAVDLPAVQECSWCRTPIDRFILAALEAQGHSSQSAGRPPDADPPRLFRPDRPAAVAGGSRGVRRRLVAARPTRSWSIGCSPARTTASAGAGTGSTWPATPTATAWKPTPTGRTPITTATSSSAR